MYFYMRHLDLLIQTDQALEELRLRKPVPVILHLMKNGERIMPTLTDPEEMANYFQKYFAATYNSATNHVRFSGNGMVKDAIDVLRVSGYNAIDVTDFLLKKRGLNPNTTDLDKLNDLLNEPMTDEEVELMRLKIAESK